MYVILFSLLPFRLSAPDGVCVCTVCFAWRAKDRLTN